MEFIRFPLRYEKLGPCEKDFFTIIRNIATKHKLIDYKIYVAGGWVRDYQMGDRSQDLDIIIDDRVISIFIKEFEKQEQYNYLKLDSVPVKSIALSSHYCKNHMLYKLKFTRSRFFVDIKELKTPYTLEHDYKTRDFTINAMYLNVNTMEFEISKESHNDIKNKLLRCVLTPKLTFMDPIRYMRLVRILSLKKLVIDESLLKYLEEQNLTGLKDKINIISKNGIQREICFMFERKGTSRAVEYFVSLKIHNYLDLKTKNSIEHAEWTKIVKHRFFIGIELIKLFEKLLNTSSFRILIQYFYKKFKAYFYKFIKVVCLALNFYLDGDLINFNILLQNLKIKESDITSARNILDYCIEFKKDATCIQLLDIARTKGKDEPFYFLDIVYVANFFRTIGKSEENIIKYIEKLYSDPLLETIRYKDSSLISSLEKPFLSAYKK